ncbi:MAG: polyprenyl synthetase family protein [Verrucomicrobia bacterium]|nr:polyprenyl synthetase family protein [Verrucomicrobiota bacterium]
MKSPARFIDVKALASAYAQPLAQLDNFLEQQIAAFEPEVRPYIAETFKHKGKRLRPLLVLLAAGWAPAASQKAPEDVIRACAIVELVHLATLVHDDILDEAEIRHGAQTLNTQLGAHQAVLTGDALFAHALCLAADYPGTEVCRAVAAATRQVCSGEIAQTFARGDAAVSIVNYRRFIDLKTAELFAVSAWLGAWIASKNNTLANAAAQFARHLGIAYQVYDDMLDLRSQEQKAGKTLGTDWATGKFTLPFILLWQVMPTSESQALQQRCVAGNISLEEMEQFFQHFQIDAAVMQWFEAELTAAQHSLEPHADTAAGSLLPELVTFIRSAMQRLLPGYHG